MVGGKVCGLGSREYKIIVSQNEGKIRTCILARKHLNIFLLHNYSDGDNTAASLELKGNHLRLVASYMAHEEDDPPNDLVRKIASDIEGTDKDLLIGCDANAHHTQWGSTDTNVRASAALILRLDASGADVVLIQKPWMVGGKVCGLGSREYKIIVSQNEAMAITRRQA
ncbi:uncharacterized protein LOC113566111 [Drosophila persimilis]|uniref:uncharacterized protein LOC113566111 n=1 Tax=Drosophila persimilis TaxID=7234 RepID=UPI000F093416|nr:uncharacterized protein LOC113566111 [Drosophila persimilis]